MKKISLIILFFFFSGSAYLFAGESTGLSQFKEQARIYRQQGIELQDNGDSGGAMAFFQKAVQLDPEYAAAYNDLGVVIEADGQIDRAEEYYLKALKLDPNYLSTYSNLAFLYEEKRDLFRASFYWKKRWELGSSLDPWTKKAKDRFFDLAQVSPTIKQVYDKEEFLKLSKEAPGYLKMKKEEDLKNYHEYLRLANNLYKARDYAKALEELKKAEAINNSGEVLELRILITRKQSEKEKARKIKEMEDHFQKGVRYYQNDNPQVAQDEFNKIKALATSSQKGS